MAAKHGRVFVVGVGMTKFEKPGRREDFDYPQMVKESVSRAFKDCGLTYTDIQLAVCAYVYGDSTCGQRALYEFGLTGIPIYNVNNNCATGSTALHMAKQFIEGGQSDCVLAVGFEKMERGSLGSKYEDRTNPLDKHIETMSELYDIEPAPMAAQIFGNAGREHIAKYGTTKEHMMKIAYKNHKHSVHNERSQFRKEYSMEEIANCTEVYDPLTKLQCCPTSDGSAAAILCSEAFLRRHSELASRAVEIVAMEMATDTENLFDGRSMMKIAGQDMTKKAAELVYKKSGLGPKDIQVVELHDCFSCNELITYEALKLCPVGKAGEMVDRGDNTYGGKYVVNPSGGLISKGHPLGATGLAQCFELCGQLRGDCGRRQVTGATTALQHNLGLGGACVVGLYRMYNPRKENTKNSKNNKMQLESSFQSDAVFKEIEKRLETEREALMKQFKGAFCFELKKGNDTGYFYFDLKNKGCVYRGKTDKVKADCTLKMTDEDCFKLMCGKLNPQAAFLQKKVRLSGNMGLAMKLQKLQIKSLNSKM